MDTFIIALQGRFTFGHTFLNFDCLLASDWWSSFHALAEKLLIGLRSFLVDQLILNFHCLLASDWSSSFHALAEKLLIGLRSYLVDQLILNFHRLSASDWSSSFHALAEKLLIGLRSYLVDQLVMGLPSLINLWSCPAESQFYFYQFPNNGVTAVFH